MFMVWMLRSIIQIDDTSVLINLIVYVVDFPLQSSGLPPMPLFNGVGGPYTSTGFGNGSGDNLQSMWSTPGEGSASEDMQKPRPVRNRHTDWEIRHCSQLHLFCLCYYMLLKFELYLIINTFVII